MQHYDNRSEMKLTMLINKMFESCRLSGKSLGFVMLGFSSNSSSAVHLARYLFASKMATGLVLDVASASCYGTSILNRQRQVSQAVAVDINKDPLTYGKTVYKTDAIQADACYLPFRKGIFDTIVSLETIEHINDQRKFLCELQYVLTKNNGTLILSTPNKLFASPFLSTPIRQQHAEEHYLGTLQELMTDKFKVLEVYGQMKSSYTKAIRRAFSLIPRYLFMMISIKELYIDLLYNWFRSFIKRKEDKDDQEDLDPDPDKYPITKIEHFSSNYSIPYEAFIVKTCPKKWIA